MELTPGQQRLVFVVVVLALAGLGIYLLNGRESGGSPAAAPSTTPVSSAPPASAASTPAVSTSSSVPPTSTPTATSSADIYQLLPFTPADLTKAANITTAFSKAYATWSYTESANAYGATFNGLATTTEIGTLESNYDSAAAQQTANKQVSTGSGTIDAIRSIVTVPGQSTSITFTVTISQHVTPAQPGVTPSSQYAVTVTPQGSAWLVSDIELSSLGNS